MEPLVMALVHTWTDLGHAHNEDNDEDKKNFNKLNTKVFSQWQMTGLADLKCKERI